MLFKIPYGFSKHSRSSSRCLYAGGPCRKSMPLRFSLTAAKRPAERLGKLAETPPANLYLVLQIFWQS